MCLCGLDANHLSPMTQKACCRCHKAPADWTALYSNHFIKDTKQINVYMCIYTNIYIYICTHICMGTFSFIHRYYIYTH